MTVKKTFYCNLCRSEKIVEQLEGLNWRDNERFVRAPARDVENHICLVCLGQVARIHDERVLDEERGKEIWLGPLVEE